MCILVRLEFSPDGAARWKYKKVFFFSFAINSKKNRTFVNILNVTIYSVKSFMTNHVFSLNCNYEVFVYCSRSKHSEIYEWVNIYRQYNKNLHSVTYTHPLPYKYTFFVCAGYMKIYIVKVYAGCLDWCDKIMDKNVQYMYIYSVWFIFNKTPNAPATCTQNYLNITHTHTHKYYRIDSFSLAETCNWSDENGIWDEVQRTSNRNGYVSPWWYKNVMILYQTTIHKVIT